MDESNETFFYNSLRSASYKMDIFSIIRRSFDDVKQPKEFINFINDFHCIMKGFCFDRITIVWSTYHKGLNCLYNIEFFFFFFFFAFWDTNFESS